MKISNAWKIVAVLAVAGAMSACMMAKDGKYHTLFTGLQLDRAIEEHEAAGYVRAKTEGGNYRWLSGSEARAYATAKKRAYDAGDSAPLVSQFAGQTAQELRANSFNGLGRAGAWLADALTWAGITYGVTRAGEGLVSASDGGNDNSSHDASERTVNVKADHGSRVQVMVGQYNGNQASGDAMPAEEAQVEEAAP